MSDMDMNIVPKSAEEILEYIEECKKDEKVFISQTSQDIIKERLDKAIKKLSELTIK